MVSPRAPQPTVTFIDDYCEQYHSLFPEVRSFEAFKYLHVGMLSDIKRKTLPAIARLVGLENEQPLHHFLSESPWNVKDLRCRRLALIKTALEGREITLIIDDTGDRKKGDTTDYVKRQYIGNLGKIENGIVSVTAYGVIDDITIPLIFEIYKPEERLNPGDVFRTKPQIAAQMVRELKSLGFKFKRVLADSAYGESESPFISVLDELELEYVMAIRSDHGVWMPEGLRVRYNRWRHFERIFSNGDSEDRYIREIIFGKRGSRQYWQVTTDPETLPKNSTWWIMTKVKGVKYKEVGNLYGLRNWVEYGIKQSKNELGWADFRLTSYPDIEKWWEVVMSAFLLVSLYALSSSFADQFNGPSTSENAVPSFTEHVWWDLEKGWKSLLNNLRLVMQPFIFFNLLKPWLQVFPIPRLSLGFPELIAIMNQLGGVVPRASPVGE
jgi:SRSO17 transposase